MKELFHNVTRWFSANMEKAESELHYDSPFHLLIAVILSAQCTDKRVNMYTPVIFDRYPEPADLATASFEEVYELIKSISFPNNKAKHLIGMASMLVSDFGSIVPSEPSELEKLPATYTESPEEAETLVIHTKDSLTGVELDLMYTIFAKGGIIARNAKITKYPSVTLEMHGIGYAEEASMIFATSNVSENSAIGETTESVIEIMFAPLSFMKRKAFIVCFE